MSADLLLGLPAKIKKLLDRLTEVRAGYLDNLPQLDAAVTTRASATDTATILNRLTAERAAYLDLIPQISTFGPITEIYGAQPLTSQLFSSDATLVHSQSLAPSGTFTEVFNLAGPGMIAYASINLDASYVYTVDYEVEIDGALVYVGQYTYPNVGEVYIGGLTGTNYDDSVPVLIPSLFNTSFIVRAKHDHQSTREVATRYMAAKL